MEYCDLGEIRIPHIGLGLYSMHGRILKESINTAIDCGYSLFDTAFRYDNEKEIGSIDYNMGIISTKISGIQFNGHRKFLYLDKRSIKKSIELAEKKLKRDPLDVVLLHSPFSQFQKAFEELLQAQLKGDVRVVGVCGFDEAKLEDLRKSCGVSPQICMLELHPYHTSPSIVDYCATRDIKIMSRSPLAHGEILDYLRKEKIMKDVFLRTNKTIPQIVLRWCVQHGWIAIPRSANASHIRENINIFDFELSEHEMEMIDSLNQNKSFGVFAGENL